MEKKIILILSLCFIMLISSCTGKNFIIKNADLIIEMQISKRIPLYNKQEKELEIDINQFLNDSKLTITNIIPIINELKKTESFDVDKYYPQFQKLYIEFAYRFSKLVAKHLSQLDKKQQKEFYEGLSREKNDMLKIDKSKRMERIEKNFKFVVGTIKDNQKKIIQYYAKDFYESYKKKINRREKLHLKLKNIFNMDINQQRRQALIREAFNTYLDDSLVENRNIQFLKQLIPTFTSEQKEHIRNNLEELKEILKYFISVKY